VLDEPTNQLDPLGTHEVLHELKKLKGKQTIVLATQKLNLISELADKVILLNNGKVERYDIPEKILNDVRLLKKTKLRIPLIVELQQAKGIPKNKIKININEGCKKLKK
jgi:ABC-type multidrug transport system ATPase subunit